MGIFANPFFMSENCKKGRKKKLTYLLRIKNKIKIFFSISMYNGMETLESVTKFFVTQISLFFPPFSAHKNTLTCGQNLEYISYIYPGRMKKILWNIHYVLKPWFAEHIETHMFEKGSSQIPTYPGN